MKVEIRNHPAQARHPVTKKPLVHEGQPVPLLPNERAIYLDGVLVGYVGTEKDSPIGLVRRMPDAVQAVIRSAVTAQFGHDDKPRQLSQPAMVQPREDEGDLDD